MLLAVVALLQPLAEALVELFEAFEALGVQKAAAHSAEKALYFPAHWCTPSLLQGLGEMETFVEERFAATCYKAANWVYVGKTQGRGKLDRRNKAQLPIKSIWLYPLHKHFRSILCANKCH